MIESPLPLMTVVVAVAAAGFWLDHRYRWAKQVSASLLALLGGALLSNLELVAAASPVYDAVTGPITSLAIVWLLLAVDLRDLRHAGASMLTAFAVAVIATAAGSVVATLAVGHALPEAWKLAGVMTGTYAGGSLNFVSVARELELSATLFTSAIASDNVLTALWMGATLMLPLTLRRFYRQRRVAADSDAPATAGFLAEVKFQPADVAMLVALGLALLIAARQLAGLVPVIPEVLWLTTLALIVAQLPGVRDLKGAMPLGLLALHLFFVVIGIGSRIAEIFHHGPAIFVFTAIVVVVHGVLTYGGARLLGLDVETTSVASQAAIGGPSTALALAIARGWHDLALPGMIVGLLGYAVGTYAGLAIGFAMRAVLGG